MSPSKILMLVPRNMPQFIAGRRMLDTENMIISDAKVIQKKYTRINKIHHRKRKFLNIKINKNKTNPQLTFLGSRERKRLSQQIYKYMLQYSLR